MKKVLGKGLDALIKGVEEESIKKIPIGKIIPGKYELRTKVTLSSLQELIDSIKEKGIVEPIIVRPSGENFEVVCGHRRFYAAKEAGLKEIPCIVKEIDDKETLEIAIVENLQREDLNPVEKAMAFKILNEKFGLTHEEIAKKIGKARSSITNTLRILTLPQEIISAISENKITEGHARALLSLKSDKERMKVFRKMIKEKMSVRRAEKVAMRNLDAEIINIEEKFKEIGFIVEVKKKKKGGYIKIFFRDEDDFNFIIKKFFNE